MGLDHSALSRDRDPWSYRRIDLIFLGEFRVETHGFNHEKLMRPNETFVFFGQNPMVSTIFCIAPKALEQEQKRVLETEKKLLERLRKSQKAGLGRAQFSVGFMEISESSLGGLIGSIFGHNWN